jgi:hypothetical protein
MMLIGGVLLLSFVGWFAIYGMRRPRTIVAATAAMPDQLPDNWLAATAVDSRAEPTAERRDFANVGPSDAVGVSPQPTVAAPPSNLGR